VDTEPTTVTQTDPLSDDSLARIWNGAPRFPLERLLEQLRLVYAAFGLSDTDAGTVADVLAAADLRGVESHGIALVEYHSGGYRDGEIVAGAELTLERETPVSAAFEAHDGPGPVQATRAMRRCIDKASETGLCMATVRNSTHFGMAGYYARMAADAGLVGVALTNSGALTAPTFGARPMLGSNPIAVAIPAGGGSEGIVLDMSTSTVAWGKVAIARRAGKAIPPGWALDAEGRTTTDPRMVASLTPLGGTRETSGHKGYGLGLIVDVLCGPLAGGISSWRVRSGPDKGRGSGVGHCFMAWRIDVFRDPDEFHADVRQMIADLHLTPVAPSQGSDRVLVPGDTEAANLAYNKRHGVPVRPQVVAEVRRVCAEWSAPFLLGER
jgi:LDH2 family malate/lactate/ureidoglycolate dehydrogenase